MAADMVNSLPGPTPERTNKDRAATAAESVTVYASLTGLWTSGNHEDTETVLSDLLADLMHYANQEGEDFRACLVRGEAHYTAELQEEGTAADCPDHEPTPKEEGK